MSAIRSADGPGIYVRKASDWDQHGWTSVPNAVLRHPELSWEAKGAFAWLASHSETFILRAEDLADAGPSGRNRAREMLRELEQRGWLTRRKSRDPETGRYDMIVYHLHPQAVPVAQRTYTPSTAKPRAFPQVSPETAQPGAGQRGAGQPTPGQSGVLKKTTQKEPPQPPRGAGGPAELCGEDPEPPPSEPCEHGRRPHPQGQGCRECGTSKRAQEWEQRDHDEATAAAAERRKRACPMCDVDGLRMDRYRVPLSPYRTCDHSAPLEAVLAEIAATEAALDARPEPAPRKPSSTPAARAVALDAARAVRKRRVSTKPTCGNGLRNAGMACETDRVPRAG